MGGLVYSELECELHGDPDRDFLLHGIKEGFKIIDQTVNPKPVYQPNYKSATCAATRPPAEKQIREEIAQGNYVKVRHKPVIVSAMGAIPKPDGGIRLIHDGSMPLAHAMNGYASQKECQYQSLQEALDLVQQGYCMAKIRLKISLSIGQDSPVQSPGYRFAVDL